jgi:hypothetical protein
VTPRPRTLAVALLIALAGTARSGEVSTDGLPAWEEVAVAPDWLEAPPPREGFVRVVGAGKSNLRPLAYSPASHPEKAAFREVALRDCRTECARRLRPVLAKEASALAERGVNEVSLARRASRLLVDPGPPKVGGQTCTVWALWDVPLAPLLEGVPEAQRESARAALARVEFAGVPWHEGPVPSWVARPEVRSGHALVLVAERAASPSLAKADLATFGRGRVGGRLLDVLAPFFDSRDAAAQVAFEAGEWRTLRARTVRDESGEGIAWAAWDVPIDPVLWRLPEGARAAAARALEGLHRSD